MKRFSTIMLSFLCVVALGVGGYAVYAALNASISLHNNVIFNAPDDVFFIGTVIVDRGNDSIKSDIINHNGSASSVNSGAINKTKMDFSDINFTKEEGTLVYKITIENYTEHPIKVTVVPPAHNEFVTNNLDKNEIILEAQRYTTDGHGYNTVIRDKETITLTTTRISAEFSFEFDNTFSITLEKQELQP